MRRRDSALAQEDILDRFLRGLEEADDDDRETPIRVVTEAAAAMINDDMPIAAAVWASIAEEMLARGVTVAEFRDNIRRTRGQLAARS